MKDDSIEEEAMARSYADIPDDTTLKTMSYVDLCELLAKCNEGTTKFMVVEAEKQRRDNESKNSSSNNSHDHWYKKPLPIIAWSVFAGCLVLLVRHLLVKYVGITL